MGEYALYKGEILLGIGTVKELAEQERVKESTILFLASPTNKKRNVGGNRKIAIVLE